MITGRRGIRALSPDRTRSFREPTHSPRCPKVEKYFEFPGSLPCDCTEPPDKASYDAILEGRRWAGREMSEEEASGMQMFRGFSLLLGEMPPLASGSVTGNCWHAFPPLKANIECHRLQSFKSTGWGEACIGKMGCFLKENKYPSSGLPHCYQELSHRGNVYCFPPLPGFLNVPY